MSTDPKATREQVTTAARAWIDTPFRHQGRSSFGLDCVGLVNVVCAELGLSNYDVRGYARRPSQGAEFLKHFQKGGGTPVPLSQAQPGDLLVFRDGNYPCHVGIMTEKHGVPHVVHATALNRKVCEDPLIGDLKTRWIAAFVLPGVV